jgi:uncharacterized protein YkwD
MSTRRKAKSQWIAGLAVVGLTALAPAASASVSSAQSTQPPLAHIALGISQPPRAHIALRHSGNQPACANANARATGTSKPALRAAVVCLINRQRARHHLPRLQAMSSLDSSAQGWTNVMVSTGQFTHGSDFAARISAVGFHWSVAGENIATGYRTPNQVVTAWMASTGHCQNILNPTYADVGTGISARPVGHLAGGATWTQDFGRSTAQHAPSGNFGPADGCPYHA